MKSILFILIYIALVLGQNSSGFTVGETTNWIKSNTTSPFVLGRGNTGIGENFKNKINYLNTASWANSNLTMYDINCILYENRRDICAEMNGVNNDNNIRWQDIEQGIIKPITTCNTTVQSYIAGINILTADGCYDDGIKHILVFENSVVQNNLLIFECKKANGVQSIGGRFKGV